LPAVLVTLNPWFYDRDGEREVVHKIRNSGRLANTDAYGCDWLDGREPEPYAFAETHWQTYWSSNPYHQPLAPAKDHAVASTVDIADARLRRAEMAAARKAAEIEYHAVEKARRARIKQRQERWQREQPQWQQIQPKIETEIEARQAAILRQAQLHYQTAELEAYRLHAVQRQQEREQERQRESKLKRNRMSLGAWRQAMDEAMRKDRERDR
jgi:hypothetical protein